MLIIIIVSLFLQIEISAIFTYRIWQLELLIQAGYQKAPENARERWRGRKNRGNPEGVHALTEQLLPDTFSKAINKLPPIEK